MVAMELQEVLRDARSRTNVAMALSTAVPRETVRAIAALEEAERLQVVDAATLARLNELEAKIRSAGDAALHCASGAEPVMVGLGYTLRDAAEHCARAALPGALEAVVLEALAGQAGALEGEDLRPGDLVSPEVLALGPLVAAACASPVRVLVRTPQNPRTSSRVFEAGRLNDELVELVPLVFHAALEYGQYEGVWVTNLDDDLREVLKAMVTPSSTASLADLVTAAQELAQR